MGDVMSIDDKKPGSNLARASRSQATLDALHLVLARHGERARAAGDDTAMPSDLLDRLLAIPSRVQPLPPRATSEVVRYLPWVLPQASGTVIALQAASADGSEPLAYSIEIEGAQTEVHLAFRPLPGDDSQVRVEWTTSDRVPGGLELLLIADDGTDLTCIDLGDELTGQLSLTASHVGFDPVYEARRFSIRPRRDARLP